MKVLCQILKHKSPDYDHCSNGGLSERHTQVILTDEENPLIGMIPVVKLMYGAYAVPVLIQQTQPMVGPMAGGCYIVSSDTNYRKLVGHSNPISLHDRYETAVQYDILSR